MVSVPYSYFGTILFTNGSTAGMVSELAMEIRIFSSLDSMSPFSSPVCVRRDE